MIHAYASPVGTLLITGDGTSITGCAFAPETPNAPNAREEGGRPAVEPSEEPDSVIRAFMAELDAYFAGTLRAFTIPFRAEGTPFQKKVWNVLCTIPYGETIGYKEAALRIGQPHGARAVGGANHRNPIVLVIPCHRVIGTDGRLTGFGGGLDKKAYLLDWERAHK